MGLQTEMENHLAEMRERMMAFLMAYLLPKGLSMVALFAWLTVNWKADLLAFWKGTKHSYNKE